MLQHNFSRPHITNFMENVADFLKFPLAVSAIENEYLCCKQDFSIPPIKFPANSKSVHRLGNRWGKKTSVCDDIHHLIALTDRLKRKRETELCHSSP